jgi:hypothetical protein
VDADVNEPAQLADQVLDVRARTAVHLWRVLARQERDPSLAGHRVRIA